MTKKKLYDGLLTSEQMRERAEQRSQPISWDPTKHPRFDAGITEKMFLTRLGKDRYALKGFKLKENVGPVGYCEALNLVTAGRKGCPYFERRGGSRRRRVVLKT